MAAGAEGGIAFTGDQPPTAAGLTNSFPTDPAGTPGGASVTAASLQSVDDDPRDGQGGDIDKPYPGGTAIPLLPES